MQTFSSRSLALAFIAVLGACGTDGELSNDSEGQSGVVREPLSVQRTEMTNSDTLPQSAKDAIEQTTELSRAIQNMPIVAGVYNGLAQIQSVGIAYRDPRGVTIVVTPTTWGRVNGNNPNAVKGMRDEYFAKVAAPYRTNGMWWQLACHMQFAPFKATWNLDSYIIRGSYADYIANGCN